MSDHDQRWVLNHLIALCRDEELTLRFAATRAHDATARSLFTELAVQRAQFAAELVPHAQRLGGNVPPEGTRLGALHRRWAAVKDALLGHSDRGILTEAEYAEGEALLTFERALDDQLPPTARELVERQCAQLRHGHDRVQALLMH